MDNYISLFLATLQHLGIVTENEAKKLAKELKGNGVPDKYEDVSPMVKNVFEKLDVKPLVDKLPSTTQLETDVAGLSTKVENQSDKINDVVQNVASVAETVTGHDANIVAIANDVADVSKAVSDVNQKVAVLTTKKIVPVDTPGKTSISSVDAAPKV